MEYFECQEQMNLDLYEEYQEVERVIGNGIAIRAIFRRSYPCRVTIKIIAYLY